MLAVASGDKIEAGTIIGQTGMSGRTTGPHVHYEVRVDDEPVDPLRYLRAGQILAAAQQD